MAAGCADASVVLGDQEPPRYRFSEPAVLSELADLAETDNPSLTADLLELFFTSQRNGGAHEIWTATRERATDRFGAPSLAAELNSPSIETSPVISPDGLTVWFSSDRPGGAGGSDVWVATRVERSARWAPPQPVAALNSVLNDFPRLPGQHGLVMPLGSDRERFAYYSIYFATRETTESAFSAPARLSDFAFPDDSVLDGFLTDDGCTLFYVSGPFIGPADLYVSMRRTVSDPFSEPVALEELNSAEDERDPWFTPDGRQLFFSSDRSGRYEIYVAQVRVESSVPP